MRAEGDRCFITPILFYNPSLPIVYFFSGNANTLQTAPIWSKLIKDARKRKCVLKATSPLRIWFEYAAKEKASPLLSRVVVCSLSLYKIVFHFKALLWESIILLLPPPTCKAYPVARLLHDRCAVHARPPTPACRCHTPYDVGDGNIV